MATDPNWLPSTLAQSTAALVAITGGLLASRLVGLSVERHGLMHRRDDLLARRNLIEIEYEKADEQRLVRCLEWLREHHLDDLVEARGSVDVDDALDRFTPRGSSEEEMRPHLEELAATVREAFAAVEGAYPRGDTVPRDFKTLRERLTGLDPAYAEVYEGVAAQIKYDRFTPTHPYQVAMPPIRPMTPEIVYERHDRAIERANDLSAQLAALDAEIGLINEQSDRFAQPDGVWSGIWVLTLFAGLGIVFPMVVMAWRPVPSSVWFRVLLVAAFAVGFAVFMGYLIALLKRLPLGSAGDSAVDEPPKPPNTGYAEDA